MKIMTLLIMIMLFGCTENNEVTGKYGCKGSADEVQECELQKEVGRLKPSTSKGW